MDQIGFLLRGGDIIPKISSATGIGDPALRLLIGLLSGYPFAFIQRYLIPSVPTIKHIYSTLIGLWLSYFCYEKDFLHSFLSILLVYIILAIVPNRKLSLSLVFIGEFGHLLISYLMLSTENYDLDFTTAQCVLTLRLIGLAWDYFDGGKKEESLEHDQKLNRLVELPPLLEIYSYCYFYGGFLIGPQFPFRLYKQFIKMETFKTEKGIKVPSSIFSTLRCFLLGATYLGVQNVLSGYFPSSYMASNQFLHVDSFLKRIIYAWIVCKVALTRYIGVWVLGEGPCTLVGINFAGYNKDESVKGWNLLTNINPLLFEFSLNLQGVIESFNINTNDWVKRYIFKRLKFLNNRNMSSFGALMFLAIWHGFSVGYFLCFFLEFLDMEAEKKVRRFTGSLDNFFEQHHEMVVFKYIYFLVCFFVRTSTLHYGMISFELKTLNKSIAAYNALYWIGHVGIVVIYILDAVIPKPRQPKTTTQPKKEL